jgi:hypothetical protein
MNRDKGPSPLSSSKVEEWFMITFVVANSLLDLFNLLFVGWPEISDILGLRDTPYIYCTCIYQGLHLS